MVTEIQGFRSKIIMIEYSKMADIFEIFGELSYFGIFLVLIGINASPILMPPSWIVLTSFYLLDPNLNIVLLSIVGATGATIGRFFLKKISGLFRKFVGEEQKSNLDIIGDYLNRKKIWIPNYLISFWCHSTSKQYTLYHLWIDASKKCGNLHRILVWSCSIIYYYDIFWKCSFKTIY